MTDISANHAWPVFKFQASYEDGQETIQCVGEPRKVLVAVDATKKLKPDALQWALDHVVKQGDVVVFLGILHYIQNPMGYKTQADALSFNGTNETVLRKEIKAKLADYEAKLHSFSTLCREKRVDLNICVRAGYPLKAVVVLEATAIKAAHVVLDRKLKNGKAFYLQHLFCEVFLVTKGGKVEDKPTKSLTLSHCIGRIMS